MGSAGIRGTNEAADNLWASSYTHRHAQKPLGFQLYTQIDTHRCPGCSNSPRDTSESGVWRKLILPPPPELTAPLPASTHVAGLLYSMTFGMMGKGEEMTQPSGLEAGIPVHALIHLRAVLPQGEYLPLSGVSFLACEMLGFH